MDTPISQDAGPPFLAISPYVAPPADPQPALSADIRADVAIVGGGYTGLSAALALAAAGADVVLLERHFCGYGASGRNAGHLSPTICKDLPTARSLFGRETTAQLARFADHCVATAEALMQEHGIDCVYNPSGNIMAVVHPAQERRLREAIDAARTLGAHMRFLESGELRERGIPRAFLCGALEESGGTLHTGRFVGGLRRAAIARGLRVFEGTTVERIEHGAATRVVCGGGSVTARRVLMATNAYTGEIGTPGERLCPLYITLFETAPLTDAQLAAIGGWRGREGVYTAHESLESYRLTAERTIIGGSKDVQVFRDGLPHRHGGPQDARAASVIGAFRARFPELAGLPVAHAWAGWCGFTLNFLPVVGHDPRNPSLHYAVGYNGHGVAMACTLGALMADRLLGRPNAWQTLVCRKPAWMPPGLLRYLSAKALLGVVNAIDRRTDRRILHGTR